MNNPTLLLLVDHADHALLPDPMPQLPGFEAVHILIADFADPDSTIPRLQDMVHHHNVDIVLFSRNDQVFTRHSIGEMIRAVPAGYATFSGIDDDEVYGQTLAAFADMQRGYGHIHWPAPAAAKHTTHQPADGTFSLIFDTEQIGGVRYGLPRILPLLDHYGVKATFFVTGFVQRLYPDLLPELHKRGHEIGIHGHHHERLAGLPLDEQRRRIEAHLTGFRTYVPVTGANFIYRTDAATIRALAENGLDYFVVFAQHIYRPFAYRTLYTRPLPVAQSERLLWMVPVPVETYTLPSWAIQPLVGAALHRARCDGDEHISILMHPFRDGTRKHITGLERLLQELVVRRGLRPLTVHQKIIEHARQSQVHPQTYPRIFTAIQRIDQSHPEAPTGWWTRSELYFERIAQVYSDLRLHGANPVLSVEADGANVAVYPELPHNIPFTCYPLEPLNRNHRHRYIAALDEIKQGACIAFGPVADAINHRTRLSLSVPRRFGDITAFAPEVAVRAAYRLNPGRILF